MVAAVSAESVSKGYGDTVALDSVSLSGDRGDIFALLGPNGAGKTEPDSGTVSTLGNAPGEVDEERIGHLPQSFTPPERDDHLPHDALDERGGGTGGLRGTP